MTLLGLAFRASVHSHLATALTAALAWVVVPGFGAHYFLLLVGLGVAANTAVLVVEGLVWARKQERHVLKLTAMIEGLRAEAQRDRLN